MFFSILLINLNKTTSFFHPSKNYYYEKSSIIPKKPIFFYGTCLRIISVQLQ